MIFHQNVLSSFLLAHVCLLRSSLVRHETKVNVWKVGPILSSCTEGFSMGYIRIHRLDALDLVLDEAVVGGGDSLSLLRRSVNNWGPWEVISYSASWSYSKVIQVACLIIHQKVWAWIHWYLLIQKVMGISLGKEGVTKMMKLIGGRQKQATHVHRKQIGAVATSDRHSLEQTGARNTHRKDSVANVAMNIAELCSS